MTNAINEKTTQHLLKGITIPAQPQIMADLLMEMSLPEVSLTRIESIITKDASLSGSVLKVVNSPFFGLRNHIASIVQALNLLGINNVVNIVNSLSLRNSLSEHNIIEMTPFWDNAVDVATAAAAISRITGISAVDEAYTLGLFHNSGIPLLMTRFNQYPVVLKNAYAEPSRRITDIENEMLDCNHSVVGYFIAKAWKLPGYICEAIADHHKTDPIFAEEIGCDPSKKNLLAILKLAENACKTYKTLGNASVDYESKRIINNILIYMGMSEHDFKDIQAELIDMGLNLGNV